jgi:hypothetical protein
MANNKKIVLGEFWVDSDMEIFVDIDDPLQGLEDMYKFQQIKALQRKLHKNVGLQSSPLNPLPRVNRPRQARSKSKGY